MAGIDSRFILASDLQSFFIDKNTGAPLALGTITFYSDVDRNTKKPVYQLTGSPGNYTYTPLPNESTLSISGLFVDGSNNNIVPYYFPYAGTPSSSSGQVELYYVVVKDANGVTQSVRQAWPNFSAADVASQADAKNFIPNGQFLSHNDHPITVTVGSTDIIEIAQGGWSLRRSHGGTSNFSDSGFERITTAVSGINDYPRWAYNFVCTSFNASDQIRDLTIEWPNVYKFASGSPDAGDQAYTLFFAASSNDGSSYQFDVRLIYNFGTGGTPSPTVDVSIGTITIGNGFAYKTLTINSDSYPIPSGTLGTNNDDYVAIALRGPSSAWNVQLTDFAFLVGNVAPTFFPIQTDDEMLSRGVAGWMPTPNPDGSDLYLPLVLTPTGMKFDDGDIGKVTGSTTTYSTAISTTTNELLANGDHYLTTDYSPLGIPYSRLQSKFWDSTAQAPIWGTGSNYVTSYINSGNTSNLILYTNKLGAQTAPANGTSSPTFTYTELYPGNSTINYKAFSNSTGLVTAISTFTAATNGNADPTSGTSTMTCTKLRNNSIAGIYKVFTVQAINAASLAAGSGNPALYFTFSNDTTDYYVWFQLTTETDPAPGGTGIKIVLDSGMAASDVGALIANALSRYQAYAITCVPVSTPILAGSYFTFNANSTPYYIWYTVDGSGSDPAVVGSTGIKVELVTGDTAAIVASKTQAAINSLYFAVPDFRGLYLRGADPSAIWDIDVAKRYSTVASISSSSVGSIEVDQFLSHNHPGSVFTTAYTKLGGGSTDSYWRATDNPTALDIAVDGGSETRTVNAYVNWYIKY